MKDTVEELTYLPDEPNMTVLESVFNLDIQSAADRLEQIEDAKNQRNQMWPGKTRTQRKEYKGAKPWVGASDQEVPLIEYGIDTLVALMMNAYDNGYFFGVPVGSDDVERASVTSQFTRWLMHTASPNTRKEVELAANHLCERADVCAWIGWQKKKRRHYEEFTIEDVAEVAPDLAESIMDEATPVDELLELFREIPNVTDIPEKKAKKALRELRKTGVASIPVAKGDVSRPDIQTKELHSDVILPFYTTDPQKADRVHVRFIMSAQALYEKVANEEWDKDVVDYVVENCMGINGQDFHGRHSGRDRYNSFQTNTFGSNARTAEDSVVVVRSYQRFIDPDDGAEAIYETVWFPSLGDTKKTKDKLAYAKFGILNGWDQYPLCFGRWKEANKRFGDIRGIVDSLRGTQRQAKITRDGTVDQTSLLNSPPRTYLAGQPPKGGFGAGAEIPIYPGQENLYRFLDVPDTRASNVNLERYLDEEVAKILGLNMEDPIAIQKQQHTINKFLFFVSDVAKMVYKCYQKYGEDEIHFRVTGVPDPIVMNKSPYEEELDVTILFDSRSTNPEWIKDINEGLASLAQSDRTGRIDPDAITDIRASLLVPQYAGRLLRPSAEAREDVINRVLDDISKIALGVQVNANTQGAQTALQFLDGWQQSERGMQMLQDPIFATGYQAYRQQYEMAMQQQQNAEIGRNVNPNAAVSSET